MKRETLFLKAVIILIALPVLALCVWGLPSIIKEATDTYPAAWVFSLLVIMYLSAIPYFWALVQAYRLLSYIDKNEAFSELSVRALRWIKYCGAAISILYAASEPFLYLIAERDDAPGLILMGMIVIFASFVIAVFAAVLEKLLKNAIDIKSENDLTV